MGEGKRAAGWAGEDGGGGGGGGGRGGQAEVRRQDVKSFVVVLSAEVSF